MTEQEKQLAELDMLVAELDYENRLLRARNERLEKELDEQKAQQTEYASEADTEELVRLGSLPEPLRLAAMLEKTMQWPLHGKAADCLRRMHAALEGKDT